MKYVVRRSIKWCGKTKFCATAKNKKCSVTRKKVKDDYKPSFTKINKKILKTTLLLTSDTGTKENCYFSLQVSVPNPNSLCTTYASTCP